MKTANKELLTVNKDLLTVNKELLTVNKELLTVNKEVLTANKELLPEKKHQGKSPQALCQISCKVTINFYNIPSNIDHFCL
jgi:hypothetical protein